MFYQLKENKDLWITSKLKNSQSVFSTWKHMKLLEYSFKIFIIMKISLYSTEMVIMKTFQMKRKRYLTIVFYMIKGT